MIRQRINKFELIHLILFFISLVAAFYTIAIHIGFLLMPAVCVVSGFLSFQFFRKKAVLLLLFLIPVINSFPALLRNGYPFNLMALILFWLSGIVLNRVISDKISIGISNYQWGKFYYFFLFIIWLSAVFVFLRWSNILFEPSVFLADTPVSPGSPLVPRNSFASIYPVITLFLYTAAPFCFELIRMKGIKKKDVLNFLLSGYIVSFSIALIQHYIDPEFLSVRMWTEKLGQSNGGFSDFNGFGIFSGILFLYSILQILNNFHIETERVKTILKENLHYFLASGLSLFGIFFSGSRTAFIFLLAGFLFFLTGKKIKKVIKITVVIMLIMLFILTGSILEKRLKKSFEKIFDPDIVNNPVRVLDKVTNGRVGMIIDSIPMIKKYPLTGVGTGNFIFYRKYLKFGSEFMDDLPLNQYLLVLDENGLPGILFFVLFFIFIFKSGIFFRPEGKIVTVFSIILLVGNSFWLPEIFILFWILLGLGIDQKRGSQKIKTKLVMPVTAVFVIFFFASLLTLDSVHPSTLMGKRGLKYDFGFWEESVKSNFRWTKRDSGIFLQLNDTGESPLLRIKCGAPLKHLEVGYQEIILKWKGNIFKKRRFIKNEEYEFKIIGEPFETGFLEIEVSPLFNLKKLGLGRESRDLGIMFFN